MSLIARIYPADATGLAAKAIAKSRYFVPGRSRQIPRRDERATTSPLDFDVLDYLPSCELTFAQPRLWN